MAMDMNKLLELALQHDASDIHLTVNKPPAFRIHGDIKALNTDKLTPDDTATLMKQITSERGQQELAELGSTDFAIGFQDKARFRVNVFQKGLECFGLASDPDACAMEDSICRRT